MEYDLAYFLGSLIGTWLHEVTIFTGVGIGILLRKRIWAFAVSGILTAVIIVNFYMKPMAIRLNIPDPDLADYLMKFLAGATMTLAVQGILALFRLKKQESV